MKVLVIGGGGREHALVWKLAQSPLVEDLYCAPGNPGMVGQAQLVALDPMDMDGLLDFARQNGIDLTVVGPEAPLVAGIADRFAAAGLLVAGPSAYCAQLEGSKAFAKDLMRRLGVPTADYRVFEDAEAARDHVRASGGRVVVKADGLCGGKGVLLCQSPGEAEDACQEIMTAMRFGQAGCKVVVEEWLDGEEASFLVFCDGHTVVPMPTSQDHKAVGEGDTGPNTGGMGAYSPAPVVTPEVERRVMEQVIHPVIQGLAAEGHPFKGVLYAGLMIDGQGNPKVLEFNVRFGDPECQPLMMRLDSDLAQILMQVAQGRLDPEAVRWSPRPAVCVVLAAGGYPLEYAKGQPISGLELAAGVKDVVVFHAGTKLANDHLVTDGGRVLGVTAIGDNLADALMNAYEAAELIQWEDVYYRNDIGYRAMERELDKPRALGPQVGVVMGSKNDWSVMEAAVKELKRLGITCEARVLSAHRTPHEAGEFATSAKSRGMKVIIAGAGWAAHLAGAMAGGTTLPVIGVPIDSSALNGMDALLATVQMPPGIPVATVAIGKGGAKNAAVLAAQILALGDPDLARRLEEDRRQMARDVLAADQALEY